jgi:hypothetical protein
MAEDEQRSPGAETRSEEERRREMFERLRSLRVADLVEEMLVTLVTVGYQKLGLTEQTRGLRDLRDAQLAIETLRSWIDVLARERGEEGLADLRSTVAAMQLEYVRATAETTAPNTETGAATEGAGAEPSGAKGGASTEGEGAASPEAETGETREPDGV